MPCSASAPSLHAWSPIMTAAADWAEAESLALKRLFGVAEEDGGRARSQQLADVLSDEEIDAALDAFEIATGAAGPIRRRSRLTRRKVDPGESRVAALRPVFLTARTKPRAQVCSKALQGRRAVRSRQLLDAAQAALRRARPSSSRICACAEASARGARSRRRRPRPTMSGASGRRPRSTMTTSSSRRRTCCRAPTPPPGCCTRSTAASTTSWSTRRRTPTRRNGRIIERAGRGVLRRCRRKREAAHAVRRRRREAVDLSASRAPTRRGSARSAAPSSDGQRRSVSLGTRCRSPSRSARPSRSSRLSMRCSPSLPAARRPRPRQEGAIIEHHAFRQVEAGLVELWEVETEEKPHDPGRLRALERGGGGRPLGRRAVPAHRRR